MKAATIIHTGGKSFSTSTYGGRWFGLWVIKHIDSDFIYLKPLKTYTFWLMLLGYWIRLWG